MIDLHEGVLTEFAEAQYKGLERHKISREIERFRAAQEKLKLRESLAIIAADYHKCRHRAAMNAVMGLAEKRNRKGNTTVKTKRGQTEVSPTKLSSWLCHECGGRHSKQLSKCSSTSKIAV